MSQTKCNSCIFKQQIEESTGHLVISTADSQVYKLVGIHKGRMDLYYVLEDSSKHEHIMTCVSGIIDLKTKLSPEEYKSIEHNFTVLDELGFPTEPCPHWSLINPNDLKCFCNRM